MPPRKPANRFDEPYEPVEQTPDPQGLPDEAKTASMRRREAKQQRQAGEADLWKKQREGK